MQNPLLKAVKTTLYSIPVGEKFILYAPLKPLAFIGNQALVDAINIKLGRLPKKRSKHELIIALQKTGLFEPDRMCTPNGDCNRSFDPTLCILMPTTACNLACTYCYAGYEDKKKVSLQWSVAKKAIRSRNAEMLFISCWVLRICD